MIFKIGKTVVKIEFPFFIVIALSLVFQKSSVLDVLAFCALHELGHLAALLFCGGTPEKITVSYYGVGLKYDCPLGNAKNFFVLVSGVIVNIVFAILDLKRNINIALAVINLLPVYPLDGGRILKLVLSNVFSLNVGDRILYIISAIIVAALLIFSIMFKNPSLALIAVYVIAYAINNSFD